MPMELPSHLAEKYRNYAIHFDNGLTKNMIIVHIGRPVKFKSVLDHYIMDHIELTIQKTNVKLETANIVGVQKVPNDNKPDYELTINGVLLEIGS
jgi:hypothetical protein